MTEEQKEDIKLLKELIADTSIPNDDREIYQEALNQILAQTKSDMPKEAKEKMPKKEKATPKAKASKKPKAEKPTALPSDVDAMKKAIKERTGKTEAECEDIIAQYRKLRAKAKVNNAKRTEKLKSNDDLITGTNVITPVAQIEKDAEIVKAKIEKQVEQIENKAEREVVKKDKTKDEVKVEVEQKVVKQLAKLSDEMVSSATTFVKNIQTELKKVDKTEAKNFLLGLRNEIDALLSKFGDGGTTEIYNIAEMNSSSSSVNPSKFARGGSVDEKQNNRYWKPINEETLSFYNLTQNSSLQEIDYDVTFLNGKVWIAFKKLPNGVTQIPYEVKMLIKEDFEYYSYGANGSFIKVSLIEGSWFSMYIDFENLTFKQLEEMLLQLPLQVEERLEDKNIKGYGELGFYDYGQYIELEISNTFSKGGSVFAKGKVILFEENGVGGNKNKTYQLIKFDYTDGSGDEGFEIREMPTNTLMGQGTDFKGVLDTYNLFIGKNKEYAKGGGVDRFEVGENAHLTTGEKNKMYLDSLRMPYKQAILENISESYGGISIEQVENEVYDNDAEMLYEYITNNDNLRKRVYGEQSTIYSNFKRGGGVRIGGDGREYPFGSAWALEHNKNNKSEKYEIPTSSRKS